MYILNKETGVEMSKIILAKDMGGIILDMLKDAIHKEEPDSTPEEREISLYRILTAMSRSTDGR